MENDYTADKLLDRYPFHPSGVAGHPRNCISQLNAVNLHRHQKRVSMATERKQFCFSGIECHKPSVTPFHNTTQV